MCKETLFRKMIKKINVISNTFLNSLGIQSNLMINYSFKIINNNKKNYKVVKISKIIYLTCKILAEKIVVLAQNF